MAKYFKPFFATCRAETCKAPIAIILTTNNKKMLVDVDSLTEQEKDMVRRGENFFYKHGQHMPHWATCPEAKKFKKSKKKKGQ